MFRLEQEGEPVLVCRPMKKFFNLNENPFTMGIDPETLIFAMLKEDGSLISTYLHNGGLAIKTKGSINSEQVQWAGSYLLLLENKKLFEELEDVTKKGFTVNMEFVSPDNRIVLPYQRPELKVLNIRNNKTGFVDFRIPKDYEELRKKRVTRHEIEENQFPSYANFLSSIPDMKEIEGFVVAFRDEVNEQEGGIKLVKHKTTWYLTLHASKDSINFPRHLFECVINEATDDLRSLFHDDRAVLERIREMETKVIPQFNHIIHTVDKFHEDNKHLSRKDYAIKGTKELKENGLFSLAMNKFLSKPNDYKEFAIKNYEMFGIKGEIDVDQN